MQPPWLALTVAIIAAAAPLLGLWLGAVFSRRAACRARAKKLRVPGERKRKSDGHR